jgi:hypothetical protein
MHLLRLQQLMFWIQRLFLAGRILVREVMHAEIWKTYLGVEAYPQSGLVRHARRVERYSFHARMRGVQERAEARLGEELV